VNKGIFMINAIIFGAGSIGNHLAYACRQKNWCVSIFYVDKSALIRTKNMIYPSKTSCMNLVKLLLILMFGLVAILRW
jgi:prephenate dehydrogenase